MSSHYDTTCSHCGYGFAIDDVYQATFTDLTTKVICFSCLDPALENGDNLLILSHHTD